MGQKSRLGIWEEARQSITEYLTLFLPDSWKEPMEHVKTLIYANREIDWEALKGHMLIRFDESMKSGDRVETLRIIERAGNSLKELHDALSPAEWHLAVNNVFLAAHFRASKVALKED